MVPFFVQIKCHLGKSYQVANAIADAEIASEVYSTAGDFDLLQAGASSGNVPFFRFFDPGGARLVSLYRQNGTSNQIYVNYGGTYYATTGKLALNTWATFSIHLTTNGTASTVAITLNGLALLYRSQALYDLAEPLYARALRIWEKAVGPGHPDVAIALVEASLIRFLRGALLAPRAGAGAPGPRLQTASIVTLALCESVGVFGVVLFVISGSAADFYLFLALSLGLFAIYFPRHDRWEEWARQMAPRT